MRNAIVSRCDVFMMAWVFVGLSWLWGATGSAWGADSDPLNLSRHVPYPVLQVIDGDTIVIKCDSRGILMQLRGVEASREDAKTYLRGLLAGESVYLDYPPEGPRDRDGHISAYFFRVKDKLFVNQKILSLGYGVVKGDAGPHSRLFPMIEETARYNKRGLWSTEDLHQPLAPSKLAIAERARTIELRRALHERWRYLSNAAEIAELESEAAMQLGTSVFTVKNDRDAKFRLTLHGGLRPVSLIVPAGTSRSVTLINGQQYQPTFRFGDEPGDLYRGDPILVDNNDPTITIGARHDGSYPVRKVL